MTKLTTAIAFTLSALLGPLTSACSSQTSAAAHQPGAPSSSVETNRRLVDRYFNDMWNRMDHATADQIVAADVVGHVNSANLSGIDKLHARIDGIAKTYATMTFRIDHVVADGDHVAVRWTQHGKHSGAALGPATAGKEFKVTGMSMFRMAGGRIAEIWVNSDDLGELEQIGAVKPPPGW